MIYLAAKGAHLKEQNRIRLGLGFYTFTVITSLKEGDLKLNLF